MLDWNKQWYPVQAVQNLDPAKPHSITLLGMFVETTLVKSTTAQRAEAVQGIRVQLAAFWIKHHVCHIGHSNTVLPQHNVSSWLP